MNCLQPLLVDMGIDLRGSYIGMAKHHLHRAQVGSVGEQVGGERVTQHVRGDLLTIGLASSFGIPAYAGIRPECEIGEDER